MNDFRVSTVRSVISERNCSRQLAQYARQSGARHVLLITDPGLRRLGLLDEALAGFTSNAVAITVFDGVSADPPESNVLAGLEHAAAADADLIVGFGGGSSMDVAKLVALLGHPSCTQSLSQVYGVDNARGPRLPLILVPTTAGTGSEVTPVAVITTGETTKMGVSSSLLLPDLVLLDAALTLGLPPAITAATGVDAMVHAIEAYTSKIRKNPWSDMLAVKALQLLSTHIRTAVHDGGNYEARAAMLFGAMLAGQAFANAPVAAVHALAYPVGGRFHVSHGLSNSLVLPPVLRFNAPAAETLYAELAPHIGCVSTALTDASSRCEAFIAAAEQIIADVDLPRRLSEVGIAAADLDILASDAMMQTRLLVNNPREVTERDARAIYAEVL